MTYEVGLYDKVVDTLLERQELVKGELSKRFKKTKPFREDPVDKKELFFYYDQMCNDYNAEMFMDTLVQRHGRETVNIFIQEMEDYRKQYVKDSNKGV